MSLEDKILENTVAINNLIGTIKNYSFIPTTTSTGNPVKEKTRKTRRTKAEMEADKSDPTSLDLGHGLPPIEESGKDPLDILDTPQTEEEKKEITEEILRAAASELVEVSGKDNTDGLETAKKLIRKLGFETLASVTKDKYKMLYDAFRLAVTTWKK